MRRYSQKYSDVEQDVRYKIPSDDERFNYSAQSRLSEEDYYWSDKRKPNLHLNDYRTSLSSSFKKDDELYPNESKWSTTPRTRSIDYGHSGHSSRLYYSNSERSPRTIDDRRSQRMPTRSPQTRIKFNSDTARTAPSSRRSLSSREVGRTTDDYEGFLSSSLRRHSLDYQNDDYDYPRPSSSSLFYERGRHPTSRRSDRQHHNFQRMSSSTLTNQSGAEDIDKIFRSSFTLKEKIPSLFDTVDLHHHHENKSPLNWTTESTKYLGGYGNPYDETTTSLDDYRYGASYRPPTSSSYLTEQFRAPRQSPWSRSGTPGDYDRYDRHGDNPKSWMDRRTEENEVQLIKRSRSLGREEPVQILRTSLYTKFSCQHCGKEYYDSSVLGVHMLSCFNKRSRHRKTFLPDLNYTDSYARK